MSEPITLTEREVRCLHEVAAEIHRLHTELKRRRANAASASPPRVPGASAHPHGAGVESGPGQPIDICEQLEASAAEWSDQNDEDAILSREAAAEIRRLREQVKTERRAGIEAAAKYHVAHEAACWAERDAEGALRHEKDAAAIRALADKPAPDAARKGG